MSNERDEMAYLIRGEAVCSTGNAKDAADALIEIGYRKPRTITTAEEMDTLPVGSVIHDGEGDAWQRYRLTGWAVAGGDSSGYEVPTLPAVVLWEPEISS